MSTPQKATIKDVARAAGVSVATVSRALNNIGVVREDTRRKVIEAVTRLNYAPNVHASSLAKGHSNLIGLVVADMTNPFFNELSKEIWSAAKAHDLDVLITNTSFDPDVARDCIEDLIEAQVAGIIILTSVFDFQIIEELANQQIPLCLLDISAVREYVSNISVNLQNSTVQVIEHLISLGHENIVYGSIKGPLKQTPERNRIFELCCQKYAAYIKKYRIVEGEYSLEGGRKVIERLFSGKSEPPTAVWFTGDVMAVGAMKELRRKGLRVPKDVSIIGLGDTFMASYTDPELTTVAMDNQQIGLLSVNAVRHLLTAHVKDGLEYSVNSHLVIRASTGPVSQ